MVVNQRPPRRPSRVRLVVGIGVVLVVGFGLIYGFHFLFNPWAMSLPGKPALTGYWQGTVTYGPGDSRRVFLWLTDDACSRKCTNIDGGAKVCGPQHNSTYEIVGDPSDYLGTRFWLDVHRTSQGPGLYLGHVDGGWDGGDTLTITSSLVRIDQNGHSQSTTSTDIKTGIVITDPPTVHFELRRGGEADFAAAC